MLLTALSAVVATSCVVASARRLAWAVAPTPLDPGLLGRALAANGPGAAAKLRAAVAADPTLAWEEALFAAEAEPRSEGMDAAIGEQLTDYEWLAGRWSRAPRVCASVSTSAGFFLATIAVLQGMQVSGDDPVAFPSAVLFRALDALAIGIAGTAFCGAVHIRARRLVAARWSSLDALVERLRAEGRERENRPNRQKAEPG